ncbi:unnamed protein product [Symbiodinium microadriaticum]|nr:unnamed protein product [Symbiodinium microadriaticum]CAE7892452.1 unnamed protein product [Symbiodinium sp. KB8]
MSMDTSSRPPMPDSEEMPLLRLDLAWRKNEISFLATLGEAQEDPDSTAVARRHFSSDADAEVRLGKDGVMTIVPAPDVQRDFAQFLPAADHGTLQASALALARAVDETGYAGPAIDAERLASFATFLAEVLFQKCALCASCKYRPPSADKCIDVSLQMTVFDRFFASPPGEEHFKQSCTRLYFTMEKAIELMQKLYKEPINTADDSSALGLRLGKMAKDSSMEFGGGSVGSFFSYCCPASSENEPDELHFRGWLGDGSGLGSNNYYSYSYAMTVIAHLCTMADGDEEFFPHVSLSFTCHRILSELPRAAATFLKALESWTINVETKASCLEAEMPFKGEGAQGAAIAAPSHSHQAPAINLGRGLLGADPLNRDALGPDAAQRLALAIQAIAQGVHDTRADFEVLRDGVSVLVENLDERIEDLRKRSITELDQNFDENRRNYELAQERRIDDHGTPHENSSN